MKVNNTHYGSTLPTVVNVADPPNQIFRNTDNTVFVPTRIIATNITATAAHRLILVDADLTDAGEDTYKDIAFVSMEIAIPASATVILNEDDIPENLQFRYGVCGYVTDATLDVKVFIEGNEQLITSTE